MIYASVTKYALTRGVYSVRGNIDPEDTRILYVKITTVTIKDGHKTYGNNTEIYHKPDWHTCDKAARERVLEMIERKKVSLDKQYKKLYVLEVRVREVSDD